MRKLSLLPLLALTIFLTGCSYATDLAVVNLSDQPVVVKYRLKDFGPFNPDPPRTKSVAELDAAVSWHELAGHQFQLDSDVRSVTVTVAPRTALRVAVVRGPGIREDEASFPLAELVVRGAYGTISLYGQQVQKSFLEQESVYAVTYK